MGLLLLSARSTPTENVSKSHYHQIYYDQMLGPSVGAVVNDMREAQSLLMPLMMVLTFPFWVWFPISMTPNSAFAVALSFIPPINSFAMLIRLTSTAPPPWWQAWLSIGVGIGGVLAALWFASKVFKIGLLMYGKPPNFATLVRWARQA